MASVWTELKRRNVVRVAIAYAVASWLVLQLTDVLKSLLSLPEWIGGVVIAMLAVGFILALILSWAYELTPEGVKREKEVDRSRSTTPDTGRKLDFVIIGVLSIAVVIFAIDEIFWDMNVQEEIVETTGRQTIAVMPFINMSSDPEQEYFSDGLSEELLNLLAKIPELRVTSRSSAFYYKNKEYLIADVGRELGVANILEGSVRRSGDTLRITAQLIDVSDDSHLWSETWDRELVDIFVIQDEIAKAVVAGLKLRLLHEVPQAKVTSPEVYALYLQSRMLTRGFGPRGHVEAEAAIQRALELDPTFVQGWIRQSQIYQGGSASGAWNPHDGYRKAREAVLKALELDPDNAEVHARLSSIARNYDYDMETAQRELDLSLSIAPNEALVLSNAAGVARAKGEFAKSVRLLKEVEALDPLSPAPKRRLGIIYLGLRQYEQAISAFSAALDLAPTAGQIHYRIGCALLAAGEFESALAAMDLDQVDGLRLAGRAMVLQAMGEVDNAALELQQLIALGDRWTYEIAQTHAYLGNIDESFEWLERAFDRRDQSLSSIVLDPLIDNIRSDPRYDAFIERLGITDPNR